MRIHRRRRFIWRFESLEPRMVLHHATPVDLGDGLGPKFIGDGVTTIIEDFSNNPGHEDPATVTGAVDISEAQGERLFTHLPSPATPVPVGVLDLPPAPSHFYVLLVGRGLTREIQFRGIHPEYEVAAVNLEWVTDGLGQVEIVGQGGTIVMPPADPFHFWETVVTTRGAIVPSTQQVLGSIHSIRVVNLTAFQTAIDNITILIAPKEVNDPPIAWDDEAFLPPSTPTEPTSILFDVLDNDDDPEGHPLTLVFVSPAAHGTVVIEDGLVRYTPELNFHGADSFQYTVSDDKGLTATATVRVGVNNAPRADGADFFFPHGTTGPVVIPAPGLLDHGFDPDGDLLRAFLVAQPQHGMVSVQTDGSFIYTPTTPGGMVLSDVFSYAVNDGFQFSNVALAGINVPNQPPTASDVTYVFDSRPAADPVRNFVAGDADGDPITIEIVTPPQHGTVTVTPTGEFVYGPGLGPDSIDFATGEYQNGKPIFGDVTFAYRAFDGAAYSQIATATLIFPNERPVANDDQFVVRSSDGALPATQLSAPLTGATGVLHLELEAIANFGLVVQYQLEVSNISNVVRAVLREGDEVRFTLYTAEAGGGPHEGLLVSGQFDVTNLPGDPAERVLGFLDDLAAGLITVEIQTDDGRPPMDSGPGDFSDDGPLDFRRYEIAGKIDIHDDSQVAQSSLPGVLWNDFDPDGDVPFPILVEGTRYGRVELKRDGSFSYYPLIGFVGEDRFTYAASDGFLGGSHIAAVRLVVEQDAPQPIDDAFNFSITEFTEHFFANGKPFTIAAPHITGNDVHDGFLPTIKTAFDAPPGHPADDAGVTINLKSNQAILAADTALSWTAPFVGERYFAYAYGDLLDRDTFTSFGLVKFQVADSDINGNGVSDFEEGYADDPPRFRFTGIDFGDAPDSYGTRLASDGARHQSTGPMLGRLSDGEADGQPNQSASGDDQFLGLNHNPTAVNDDDGPVIAIGEDGAKTFSVNSGSDTRILVNVSNPTSETATLWGWVDWNLDGEFDNATERGSFIVEPGAVDINASFTFPASVIGASLNPVKTYARFRISTDPAAANPTGMAADGEVEDYIGWILPRNPERELLSLGGIDSPIAGFSDFGASLAAIGDLDGDGVGDMAVGAPSFSDDLDAVWIFLLNADQTIKSQHEISATAGNFTGVFDPHGRFGNSLAGLGDVDGDGVVDLAVAEPGSSGKVWLLFLRSDGTVKAHHEIDAAAATAGFAESIATVGDIDGDGVADLAVGAPFDHDGANNAGAVWVLFLNANGTVKSRQKISAQSGGFSGGLNENDHFGSAIAGLGDLNGDGTFDLAVGATGDDDGARSAGAVWVLFLNANGLVTSHQKISNLTPNLNGAIASHQFFGGALARIDDLDGDGIGELAVGAGLFADVNPIWLLSLTADGSIRGFQKRSDPDFIDALAAVDDLDGDGIGDLAVNRDSVFDAPVRFVRMEPLDWDADGVAEVIEDNAPGDGDGNGDGTPDKEQPQVASLPNTGDQYVTFAAPAGTGLVDVAAVANPSPTDSPPDAQFPLGHFEFSVQGLVPGGATTVEVILHDEPVVSTYYKYGPTPTDPRRHWYEFLFDGTTGAELINDDADPGIERILLHFVDGQRGDDHYNLGPNGVIVDPGGPALIRSAAAPKIERVVINDGHAQRSKINSITVNFDSAVTIDPGALELVHESGIRIALDVAASLLDGRTVAVLTFSSPGIIGGSLFNGEYTLMVDGDKVRDQSGAALDGDNNGAAGGTYREEFFRRFGDSDGDGDVDRFDRKQFISTFLRPAVDADYVWYFDWNDDGRVGVIDLLAFTVASLGLHR